MDCPRCDGRGRICRASVAGLGAEVYVCDGCRALWTHPAAIGPATFVDLDLFLKTHGVDGGWAALEGPDPAWDRDPRLAELEAEIAARPDEPGPRLRLAELLAAAGQPAGALEQLGRVLTLDPANLEALRAAASAAEALGDTHRAAGYRRLLAALGQADPPPRPEPPGPPAGPDQTAEAPGRPRLRVLDPDDSDEAWQLERPPVKLADVAGMEQVKHRLQVAFLGPLQNPELRRLYGKSLRGGLLLFGPPGCGKTFIARATAGELGARFVSVGLSDVLDMWLGESERKLHELFATARRNAPTVLFFDEIDALGQRRSHLRHQGGRNIVNQLLAELDGVDAANDGLFVLGATNHPWDVDAALMRPGRFDRLLLVLPPDPPARRAVLAQHLADRPTAGLDLDWLAQRTAEFSGADLAHLCESAAELALEASLTSGAARPIGMDDLRRALRELRPSCRAWFETARNYALFANEGGMYDELVAYMRANKLL